MNTANQKPSLKLYRYFIGWVETVTILLFLGTVFYYFYGGSRNFLHDPILNVLVLSFMTDGIFLFLHLPRKHVNHKNVSFDPEKLTVVIACYNGEDIIGETITQVLTHVKPENIIVVSDASTDNTAETARKYGVRVFVNPKNLNKAFSISFVMHEVKTPYVLILDDDTLIGKTFIPTSLLDEGYDAVAFNVMPLKTGTLVNAFQIFEYRKSMMMGKGLRGSVGAVGNISGALGLYRTADLMEQVTKHSGQFGGEDQQRTAFVHLYGQGKGITYTDSLVITKAPDTIKQLFRQRSFRWNLSLPELFFVYSRVLFNPRFHYLLKVEKAYQMYLLVTDPIRMLFFWIIFFHPVQAFILYLFYILFTFIVWIKIGRKDPVWVVLLFPVYSLAESICRFIAHFYWFKIKYEYLFKKKFHTLVSGRKLLWEYGGVFLLLIFLWGLSARRLVQVVTYNYYLLTIYEQEEERIRKADLPSNHRSTEDPNSTPINSETKTEAVASATDSTQIEVTVEKGNGRTNIARKAIDIYLSEKNVLLTSRQSRVAEDLLQEEIKTNGALITGQTISLDKSLVEEKIEYAINTYQN